MARFSLSAYDKQHLRNLLRRIQEIDKIFDSAILQGVRIGMSTGFNDPKGQFRFPDYPHVQERVAELLQGIREQLQVAIEGGVRTEWQLSTSKNDALVDHLTKGLGIPKEVIERYKSPNTEALEAFLERKTAGMNLSNRVWNLSQQFKTDLEMGLSVGIGEGRSAAEISRDVRQCLREPDNFFRRFRYKDEGGNWRQQWKKRYWDDATGSYRWENVDLRDYATGRGVYRSSYKNALRLAATENNMAYRTSDHERWQQMDFVIGIEIKLSNNHPVEDICDELCGVYPKTFKFTGWHPFCRCIAVPKLADEDEFIDRLNREIAGEDIPEDEQYTGTVTEMPPVFNKWVEVNADRLEAARNLPYFVTDNWGAVSAVLDLNPIQGNANSVNPMFGCLSDDPFISTRPTPIQDITQVKAKLELVFSEHPEYFARGFKSIEAVSETSTYMYTDAKGRICINFAVDKNGFNAGESLVSAISKIEVGKSLTQHEEYAIEVLWHEILHNKSKNTALLPKINSVLGFARTSMETINQLVARHSYGDFLRKLGGEAVHSEWILNNGYGYGATVTNLRKLLSTANIEEKTFINSIEKELMKDYKNFDKKVGNALKRLYKGKGDISRAFDFIEASNFDYWLRTVLH